MIARGLATPRNSSSVRKQYVLYRKYLVPQSTRDSMKRAHRFNGGRPVSTRNYSWADTQVCPYGMAMKPHPVVRARHAVPLQCTPRAVREPPLRSLPLGPHPLQVIAPFIQLRMTDSLCNLHSQGNVFLGLYELAQA